MQVAVCSLFLFFLLPVALPLPGATCRVSRCVWVSERAYAPRPQPTPTYAGRALLTLEMLCDSSYGVHALWLATVFLIALLSLSMPYSVKCLGCSLCFPVV